MLCSLWPGLLSHLFSGQSCEVPVKFVLLLSPFPDGETDSENVGRLTGAHQRRCRDSALRGERLEATVLAAGGRCCLLRAVVPLRGPQSVGELSLAGMSLLSHLPS